MARLPLFFSFPLQRVPCYVFQPQTTIIVLMDQTAWKEVGCCAGAARPLTRGGGSQKKKKKKKKEELIN
jgi:hypothetical protein